MAESDWFTCERCHYTYQKQRPDSEAFAEYARVFPEMQNDPVAVLCTPCYDLMLVWWMFRTCPDA